MHGNNEPHKSQTAVAGEPGSSSTGAVPDESLAPLVQEIRQKHGDALLAIVVYGSWLRGKRDTMLDFYVLVEDYRSLDSTWQGWMCSLLPPNVYHIHQAKKAPGNRSHALRAKYALLTLKRFHHAVQHDFHSYFWARFAQPCEIVFVRDESTRATLTDAFRQASTTFMRRVLPAMDDQFSCNELWTRGLSLTYQSEIRTESTARGESIYAFNPTYYEALTQAFANENSGLESTGSGNLYSNKCGSIRRKLSPFSWWLRRVQGKLLSVLRLCKAAFTFNQPLEYLLWKIERHSGIYIEPTQRQLRHPLVFAWPLLWKLRKQGAFR